VLTTAFGAGAELAEVEVDDAQAAESAAAAIEKNGASFMESGNRELGTAAGK
jgi:hypothetical protein